MQCVANHFCCVFASAVFLVVRFDVKANISRAVLKKICFENLTLSLSKSNRLIE
jgi:hypothetical protein